MIEMVTGGGGGPNTATKDELIQEVRRLLAENERLSAENNDLIEIVTKCFYLAKSFGETADVTHEVVAIDSCLDFETILTEPALARLREILIRDRD